MGPQDGNYPLGMRTQDLRDFTRSPLRSRLEAALLAQAAQAEPAEVVRRKAEVIGGMSGTVMEIGPGPGTNMRYYAPGTRVLAVEPNPAMHPRLQAQAAAHDIELSVMSCHAEQTPLADASVDGVVGTLVLCGVDRPADVVAEVRRVMRPGSHYLVYEHVKAPTGTLTRRGQQLLWGPHRWLFNGCEVDRDTGVLLQSVGFAELDVQHIDAGLATAHTRTRIMGVATR